MTPGLDSTLPSLLGAVNSTFIHLTYIWYSKKEYLSLMDKNTNIQ